MFNFKCLIFTGEKRLRQFLDAFSPALHRSKIYHGEVPAYPNSLKKYVQRFILQKLHKN